jgi:ribose/xylose/arabinose/galactoside ABC-type transport system permease subunit
LTKLSASAPRPGRPRTRRPFIASRSVQLVAFMVVIVILSNIANPEFLSPRVISNIFIAATITAFLAFGQMLVMVTRGIDLSVSPILGLSAVIVGFQGQDHGLPLPLGLLLGAGVGIVLGAFNGLLVSVLRIPPIIATLGTFSIFGGLQFIVTNGEQINQIPREYTALGVATNTVLPGIPWILVAGIACAIAISLVLRHTYFGRNLFATGGDPEAAFRAGIPTQRVIFFAYVACGMLAGIGGVVYLMRTGSADAITGTQTNENLTSIAAALIGGAALTGGRGTASGAILGAIFLSLALTAMGSAAHVPPEWQPAGVGVLILLAVVADRRARNGGELTTLLHRAKRKHS